MRSVWADNSSVKFIFHSLAVRLAYLSERINERPTLDRVDRSLNILFALVRSLSPIVVPVCRVGNINRTSCLIDCDDNYGGQKVCSRHHVGFVAPARQEAPVHVLIVYRVKEPPVELHTDEQGKEECE